jgi:hypothetical protein
MPTKSLLRPHPRQNDLAWPARKSGCLKWQVTGGAWLVFCDCVVPPTTICCHICARVMGGALDTRGGPVLPLYLLLWSKGVSLRIGNFTRNIMNIENHGILERLRLLQTILFAVYCAYFLGRRILKDHGQSKRLHLLRDVWYWTSLDTYVLISQWRAYCILWFFYHFSYY